MTRRTDPRPVLARLAAVVAVAAALLLPPTIGAQAQERPGNFSSAELVDTGHRFFGNVSGGLATLIERAASRYGQPNGYILGEEGSGAVVGGLRYGEGTLYTRNAGRYKVFWQGPSVGWDFGGDGARTMMLVYNLPDTNFIYRRFVGVNGSAYLIGGLGMTALVNDNVYVVPVRAGIGARLGVNIGYLKFTPTATWNPF